MERFEILGLSDWRPLARGGLAAVWQARQRSLDRLVAVKVYQPGLDEDERRRFLREVIALGRLSDHPGIVTVYDAGISPDDRPYLIMELCSGGSLTRWLQPDNRLSEERVRQLGVRIADALAAVHAAGVLHRDIKPANILLDGYGNPRLADFGLVAVDGTDSAAEALRITPAYAPPEAFDMQPASEFGDVYSLAATLYALVAGRPPRRVSEPMALEQIAAAAKEPAEPLRMDNGHFADLLRVALSVDPAARPTAARFRDQLNEAPAPETRERPALALVAGGVRSVDEPPRRRGRRLGMLALTAVLVVTILSAATWLIRGPESQHAVPAPQPSRAAATAPTTRNPSAIQATPSPDVASPSSLEPERIALQETVLAAEPFQTVPIRGRFREGGNGELQVQRWEEGSWLDFPLQARADQSGRFTAYVELGQPGRYRLRVRHPDSGVSSEPLVVVVRG
jgi:hypothetical protein